MGWVAPTATLEELAGILGIACPVAHPDLLVPKKESDFVSPKKESDSKLFGTVVAQACAVCDA